MTSIMVDNDWVKRAFRKPETSYQQLPDFDFVWMLIRTFLTISKHQNHTRSPHLSKTLLLHVYLCCFFIYIAFSVASRN